MASKWKVESESRSGSISKRWRSKPVPTCLYNVGRNNFDGGKSISRAIGWGGPWKFRFLGPELASSELSSLNAGRMWRILKYHSWTRHGLLFFLEADDDLLLLQDFELAEVELLLDILLTGECLVHQIQLPSLGKATKFSHRCGTYLLFLSIKLNLII